jgi:soluble lytic murein transglycosylase-like protein
MVSGYIRIIIENIANKYSLDSDLVEAIVMQESSGDTNAVRVEFAFYEKYTKPMRLSDTEEICRGMSWGLMQIMGQVAREQGFTDKYFTVLCYPEIGLQFGCRYLLSRMKKYPILTDAIAAYNSGTVVRKVNGGYLNQKYVDGVLSYLKQIKEEKHA